MKLRTITLALITLALTGARAFSQSTPTVKGWNADTIVWQSAEADGTKHAILEGDRHAAGKPFTYAMLVPPGAWDNHTHSHNHDARCCWRLGRIPIKKSPRVIRRAVMCSSPRTWSTPWAPTKRRSSSEPRKVGLRLMTTPVRTVTRQLESHTSKTCLCGLSIHFVLDEFCSLVLKSRQLTSVKLCSRRNWANSGLRTKSKSDCRQAAPQSG